MKIKFSALMSFLTAVFLLWAALASGQEAAPLSPGAKKLERNLVQSGKFYFASKNYEAAIRQWATALTLNPNNKAISKYIEDARKRLKNLGEVEKSLINMTPSPKEMISRLSLKDCIDIAVKNHIPLQIADKSIKLAEQKLWEARRNMLPTLGIRFEEYSGRVQGRAYVGRKQYLEGQQPVFHGGELYFTVKQAEVNLEVVRNDYARIRNELVLQVKKGYHTLLKAKENLALQTDLSQEVTRIFGMVQKEFEEGLTSRLELLNVSSQMSQVRFQFVSAEGDEAVAELILKQAMNADPKMSIDIKPMPEFKKAKIDFDKTMRLALMNRPEMRINTLMINYYKYGKKITDAKGWLKVDIMGNWGLAKEEYTPEDTQGPTSGAGTANPIFDPDRKLEQQWYAGFKASVPFWGSTGEYSWTKEEWVPVVSAFQGTEAVTQTYKFNILDNLKYYSDRQSADIDFDRARQELNKIKQDITLEVREGCFNYQKALIQLETASNKVKYQEKDLELNRLRREMDEVQDSNVIESLIKLAQEKFGYEQALTDCHIAVASVNKAIGVEDYFSVDAKSEGQDD